MIFQKMLYKKRRGTTLLELVIAMALMVMILGIVFSITNISLVAVHNQQNAVEFQQGADSFVFNMLVDMKSAYKVETEPEKITVYKLNEIIIYEVNNLRGEIKRNGEVEFSGFRSCYFINEGMSSFILQINLTESAEFEYPVRCGISDIEGG